jgi:hypothetical protein
MVSMYAAGFAAVWVSVALLYVVSASLTRIDRDWDRAFIRELQPELRALEEEARTGGRPRR